MQPTASLIQEGFLVLLSISIIAECALAVLQTHAAERAAKKVPERFEGKIPLAAHKKAADYTAELTQATLLLTFAGAGAALLMTYGQGLTVLASLAGALSSNALIAQWFVIAMVLLILAAIDVPFSWYLHCRIPLRFGYFQGSERKWLAKRIKSELVGWLAELPIIAALLALCEVLGRYWWVLAWLCFCAWLLWRWVLGTNFALMRSGRSKPVADRTTVAMTEDLLGRRGYRLKGLVVMKRPSGWDHSHVVLVGLGKTLTVVLFAHAAAKLSREELAALIAHNIGHAAHKHALIRTAVYGAAAFAVCWFAGWGSVNDAFFEGLGFSPYVTLAREGSHAGFVFAAALVVFPTLFYPLKPLVNLFSRAMQYDADRYAAEVVGTNALVRALVKLHRDYATTLTPSKAYSLFHYTRPHAGMRVEKLLADARRANRPLDRPGNAAFPGAPNVFDITPYLEQHSKDAAHHHPHKRAVAPEGSKKAESAPEAPSGRPQAAAPEHP